MNVDKSGFEPQTIESSSEPTHSEKKAGPPWLIKKKRIKKPSWLIDFQKGNIILDFSIKNPARSFWDCAVSGFTSVSTISNTIPFDEMMEGVADAIVSNKIGEDWDNVSRDLEIALDKQTEITFSPIDNVGSSVVHTANKDD